MIRALTRKLLAGLLVGWLGFAPAISSAASLTPPNLSAVTSINNTDLMLVWPTGTVGPLSQIQWSQVVTQITTSLGSTYLKVSNNLSDVASPSTARSNLGLGTAAVATTGTAGHVLGFLDGANTWSAAQTNSAEVFFAASASGAPSFNVAQGTAPSSPSNGDFWLTSAHPFYRINGVTQQVLLLTDVGTTSGTVAAGDDSRFSGPTQNSQSAAYGFILTDAGKQIYHPSADTTPRTWTIPANGSVAFAIGTKIELVNDCSAGAITLAITTDTLVCFTAGSTGSRTISACGMATLTKVTSTRWIITGVGIT